MKDADLRSMQEARELVREAQAAQEAYGQFTPEAADRVAEAMARAGEQASEQLARLAVEETGVGRFEHKVFKNRLCSRFLWEHIKGQKTAGVIEWDPERRLMVVAEPVGVVVGLVPVTNPTATALFKCIIAAKTRNAIILSPHPRATKTVVEAARVMAAAAVAAGAPAGLITCLTEPTLEATNELIRQRGVALVLATGGAAMVRAVYASGKPALGVGPGNVPVYFDRTVPDLRKAVQRMLASKLFDNGTACASEQAILADAPVAEQLKRVLREQGAYFLSPEGKTKLAKVVIGSDHIMNPAVVGQPVQRVAELGGIRIPRDTRLLVAEVQEIGTNEPYSLEVLAPVIAFYTVPDWRAGLDAANRLLRLGGLGHTCALHTESDEVIGGFATRARAFRLVVNSGALMGAAGISTGLDISFMLGTGTLGGGISSDNIGPQHLINKRRVGWPIREIPPELMA